MPPTSPSSSDRPSAGGSSLRTAALVLLAMAFAVSVFLAIQSARSAPVPGCDGGDCGAVLGSKWAKVFGVPVGVLGAAAYGVLAILGWRPLQPGQLGARRLAALLVVLIPAAAVWFVALQAFVIGAFCPWCTGTHLVASAGAVGMALAWRRDARDAKPASRRRRQPDPGRSGSVWVPAALGAVAALAGMAVAQMLSPEVARPAARRVTMDAPVATSSTGAPPIQVEVGPISNAVAAAASSLTPPPAAPGVPAAAGRRVSLHGGRFQIDPHAYPVFGSPDATHLVVMISDYTCRYCRVTHKMLEEVWQAFGTNQLGIVMLPSHHGGESLAIQQMMLATWRVNPAIWHRIADDVYSERVAAQPTAVRAVLERELGTGRLEAAMATETTWINNLFNLTREIHATNRVKAKSGSIPQLMIGQQIVVGAPADAAEIFQLLADNLGLVRSDAPDLVLETEAVDLGRVFAGTVREVPIRFRNAGASPLQVSRATLPPGSRTGKGFRTAVAAGQTSAVEVLFLVPRDEGPFDETVTLLSNARTSSIPVQVRGASWKPVRLQPEFLDLGRIESGTTTGGVMRVEFAEDATVESVRVQAAGFEARLREVTPRRAYDVAIATTPELAAGPQQAVFHLVLGKPVPASWPDSIAIGARVVMERAVTVVPPRLMIPAGVLATDRHNQILVRCTDGSADFQVTDAVLEGGPAFAKPQVQQVGTSRDYTVQVHLPAGWAAPSPPLSARVVVFTSHPKYPTIDVPLVVQGR